MYITRLTVSIPDNNDIPFLKEVLDRFDLDYEIDDNDDAIFSKADIEGFVKTKNDFLERKTTARDWIDVKEDLDCAFD